jgi:hypothetical protein
MVCELCGQDHVYSQDEVVGAWCYEGWITAPCQSHLCLSCGHWWLNPSDPWPLSETRPDAS